MKPLMAICAESASIDQGTGRLSLYNVLEELAGAGYPGIVPVVSFVLMLSRTANEANDIKMDIHILHNNKSLFRNTFDVSFQGKPRTRLVANLQGVPIPSPGRLTFRATHKKTVLGEWIVGISQQTPTVATMPPLQAGASISGKGSRPATTKKKGARRALRSKAARKKK